MDGRPRAVDFVTLPYPGFATDLQPMAIALAAVADGTSMITENVFEARFRFVDEMMRLGRRRPDRRAPRGRPRRRAAVQRAGVGQRHPGRRRAWCWPGCARTARPRCGTSRTSTAATRGSWRTCVRWAPTSSGWRRTRSADGGLLDWDRSSSGITRSGDVSSLTEEELPDEYRRCRNRPPGGQEPAGEGRRARRPHRLRHHLPADRLAGPAGRLRRRAASGPTRTAPSRRSPAAVRPGAAVGARDRVRRGRAVAAGAGRLRDGRRAGPVGADQEAGRERGPGRRSSRRWRSSPPVRRWARASRARAGGGGGRARLAGRAVHRRRGRAGASSPSPR